MQIIDAMLFAGDVKMAEENQSDFEGDELETIDDFDDEQDSDDSSNDPVEVPRTKAEEEERRNKARREIERRNEVKALESELNEWDNLLDEDDL
jgi:hypothetical protein